MMDMVAAQMLFVNTVRVAKMGVSASMVAAVAAIWSVTYMCVCPVLGRFVTAANSARIMTVSCVSLAVLSLLFCILPGLTSIYVLAALGGLAAALFAPGSVDAEDVQPKVSPDLIDDVILMAPDGLGGYKGFTFLQHNTFGRFFFKTATKSKWLMPAILKTLKRFNNIDESLYTIAYNEIDTPKKRHDVFYTLNLIRFLQPDVNKGVSLINQHRIKTTFIFGHDDLLFPMKPVLHVINQIIDAEVHEVPMGHWLVTPALDMYLVNLPA